VTHVVARAGNVDFTGNWVVVDLAKPLETATLEVSNEDAATGTFSGTIIPPSDATGAFVDPFTCHDARVSGDRFSFPLDRTGTGGTGPDDRNATYTASWIGTITGGTASGSIDAKLQPGTLLDPDGFAGMRSFSAHRQSSISAAPATGPVAGGNEVRLAGTGLDGAVSVQVSDMAGNLLATASVEGDSNICPRSGACRAR
jgi:hypothetical protein